MSSGPIASTVVPGPEYTRPCEIRQVDLGHRPVGQSQPDSQALTGLRLKGSNHPLAPRNVPFDRRRSTQEFHEKRGDDDGGSEHSRIVLKPLNPARLDFHSLTGRFDWTVDGPNLSRTASGGEDKRSLGVSSVVTIVSTS